MSVEWFEKLLKILGQIADLKKHTAGIANYVKSVARRLMHLDVEKEALQLKNTREYLEIAEDAIRQMEQAGCSKKEIQETAREMLIPVVQSSREAMILARKLGLNEELEEEIDEHGKDEG